MKDPAKAKIMKDFIHWALTAGQPLAEQLTYARLPKEIVAREESALAKVQ